MLRLFNPAWGTELMLKVRVGSIRPQKPPETVVTEEEFSIYKLARHNQILRRRVLTEYTSFQNKHRIYKMSVRYSGSVWPNAAVNIRLPSSVSLSATVNPAVPPPTMM